MISKKNKLDLQSAEFLEKAREEKRHGRKVECQYFLKKKRLNDAVNQRLTGKIGMVDKQIHNINTLQDDIEFGEILKSSNKVLNDLKDENSLETLEETMSLLQSSDMHQSKIRGMLEEIGHVDIDEDIRREYQGLDPDGIEQINDSSGFNQFDEQEPLKELC